jgi:putative transposase
MNSRTWRSPFLQSGARLQQRLEAGPAVSGYVEDPRWTLSRVVKLIGTMFHVRYSIKGASRLLHRMAWTPQMPSHRAVERDEAAIVAWRRHRWAAVKGSRAGWVRGSASPTRRGKR